MKNTTLAFWLVVLALLAGCSGKSAPKLHVVAHGPAALAERGDAPIKISFDRPVVEAHEVGKALKKLPLKLTPKLPLEGHWLDRQTLIATHKEPWKKATRYRVAIVDQLEDQLDQSFSFSFVHDPLDVLGVSGVDRDWAPKDAKFSLNFDQKVRAKDVVARCQLSDTSGKSSIELLASDRERVDTSIALALAKPLTPGGSYLLKCEKLVPAEGDDPLPKEFETSIHAYPKLALRETAPTDGADIPPDDLTIALTFSTPIDRAELAKHVRIKPDHPALHREWIERNQTRNELTASFEADTSYTLHIDGELRDRFGQKLGAAREISFHTSDASPSLSFSSGSFTVEADAAGYPLWSRNVASFDLSCAYVPKQDVVKVLSKQISYDVWFEQGKGAQNDQFSFEQLGLKPQHVSLMTGSKKNKWTKTPLAFAERCGGKGRGLYLAQVRSPAAEAARTERGGVLPMRVLANVTNLGVMLKVGLSSGLVWVASLKDAQPVQGAAVTLFDPEGRKVFSGASDARGLLMLPGADKLLARNKRGASAEDEGEENSYRNLRLIALVEKDADLGVVDGNWSDGIDAWNFNLRTDRSGGAVATRGFIETDRGIYRPGETVHFKGLVREVPLNGEPRVPSAKLLSLRVEDGAGAELLNKSLSLSEFGGFFSDLTLSPEARTGDYYVIAKLGETSFRQTFSVEEFRPVSFEITTQDLPEHVRLGANNKIAIEARYLFGAPVDNAEVTYQVERRRHWLYMPEYSEYSFEDWSDVEWSPWWEPDHYSDFVSQGSGVTDAKGRFSFSFKDESKGLSGPQDYLVRTSVRDAADQEVTKRVSITAHPSDLYLGVATDSWVAEVDKPFNARVVALDPRGKPLASDAKLSVISVQTRCGESDGPYGYWTCDRRKELVERARAIHIGESAALGQALTIHTPGEHLIVVEGKDARGHVVKSSTSVWVIGPGQSYWKSDDANRIGLIPSKRSYAPGDTALLVPEAATNGAAVLVTIERDGILEARIERGTGTSGIAIPITKAHAPNVFVSVAMLRGRRGEKDSEAPELKLGMVSLPVSFKERALNVQITTEGTDFEPGKTVRGKVRVLGQDGAPVRAEIALSAADEGVLSLIAYKTPDPADSIYAEWGLGVQASTNWTRIAKLHGKPEDVGEEGADSSGASGDNEARSRFVSSAYWAPALVTDAQGEASFTFDAPDNLTAFRLMAAVSDVGGRFGAAEQRIRVRKDLLITPIVPRFLLADDQIELGAVVHNYTSRAGEVEVHFDLDGVTPRKKVLREKVEANGKAVLRMPVKVLTAEHAKYQVSATLSGVSAAKDAVLLNLPIERAVVKDAVSVFAGRSTEAQAGLRWPNGLDEKASALELMVDRTGVAELGPSLQFLIQYPYGCLEQTMSRVVPLLKVRELAKSLELRELTGDKLDSYIAFGVDKIARHQHSDGQFSLWPDSQTYPHLTVYALWGLNEARRSGVRVDKRTLSLGLSALQSYVSAPERTLAPGDDTGTLAQAAFVLAELGAPDPALHARLLTAKSALPIYGKAFLLRALRRAKASESEQKLLLSEIAARVSVKDGVAKVDDPIVPNVHYFSSESRSMAMVLIALLEADPSSNLIEPLMQGLKQRRRGGRWQSTQENVYGLLALADYAKRQAAGKTKIAIKAGETSLKESTLSGGSLLRLRVPLNELKQGDALTLSAGEPVYYNAVLYQVRPEPVAQALDHGIRVEREYLDLQTKRPLTSARVGQLVNVRLHVSSPSSRQYLALTDPLPAGFESVNSDLSTERDVSEQESGRWQWDYRALRDERSEWFADDFEGPREVDYVVRATHVGTFTVPPARAEAMYEESIMGHSASHVLTVTR